MSDTRFVLERRIAEGVALRLLEERDAPELHAVVEANRDHLSRWMPWAAEDTEAKNLEFIRLSRRQLAENNGLQTGITVHDRLAGTIGLHAIDWDQGATSIGYWLAQAHEGHGIMTAAVRAYAEYAFATLGLHRMELSAAVDNVRSRAVAERAGFTYEGIQRQAERVGERWLDLALYARLATDATDATDASNP